MAAICDFSLFRTSEILRSSLIGLPDLENMGIAVGISLLSCIEAETYVISYLLRLMAAICDFSLIRTSDSLRGLVWSCHSTSKTWV